MPIAIRVPIALLLFGAIAASPALAKIVPAADGTGTEVTRVGDRYEIRGGTLSEDGTNLFHSFEQFRLGVGEMASFIANPEMHNILARVVGGEIYAIEGQIQVTGGNANLFLINPAGIVFGASANLNVPASFTATTATGVGFGDRWFQSVGDSDRTPLIGEPSALAFTTSRLGLVVNAGNLAVEAGENLSLVGGTAINTGTLAAPNGQIEMVAVREAQVLSLIREEQELSLEMLPNAQDALPQALPYVPLSLSELLSGNDISNETGLTANPNGTVALSQSGLTIEIETGTAVVSGSLSVAGTTAGQIGGTVRVLGNKVALVSAQVDASGTQGGGTVAIGEAMPATSRTYVSYDSAIAADGLQNGDGGRVVVWSEELTEFYGSISVRGGLSSGDGGLAAVSSLENLIFLGSSDLSANQGEAGRLILDQEAMMDIESAIP
jgi:filamentous hemagglutinin family protein